MKTKFLSPFVLVFMSGIIITGCQSSAKKVENAEDKLQAARIDVVEAKNDLNKTIQDSISDYQKFKKESEEIILAHEKSIAEFKVRIANEKAENRALYQEKLAQLEQKNSDLKKKLADYKNEEQDKWDTFRAEFNHDMEELGKAFKDFTVKNLK